MDTKEKILAGILVIISSLGSAGLTMLLDQGKPVYECQSKGLVSDCVNGVKACTDGVCTRCYWNLDNSRQYEYCSEGWEKQIKELEPMQTNIPVSSGMSGATKYLCDQTKCIPIE